MSELLGQHRVVALDTCVWICHLEGHPDYRGLTSEILTAVSAGKCTAAVSELTLMEMLVRPLQLEREDVVDEYEALLTHFPNVSLVAIRREILLKAAALRARYGLRTTDAIIVATGILQGATRIITNDRHWKRLEGIDVVCLGDLRE
jgi:predicted nucleic acid-binding protein